MKDEDDKELGDFKRRLSFLKNLEFDSMSLESGLEIWKPVRGWRGEYGSGLSNLGLRSGMISWVLRVNGYF